MKMEHFVHDFPLSIDFEKCEQIGETVNAPVVELEPDDGDRLDEIDACDTALEFCRRAVWIVPVKQSLDWSGKKIVADVTEDRRIGMKRFLHLCGVARFPAVDIVLNGFRNRIIFTDVDSFAGSDFLLCLHERFSYRAWELKALMLSRQY